MATNKKSFASQALLEMDDITSAIKEESKKYLSSFLNESVKNAIRESCEDDEDEDDKDYEVVDDDKDNNTDKKGNSKKSTNEDGEEDVETGYGDAQGNEMQQQAQQTTPNQNNGQMAPAGNYGQEQEPEMGGAEGQESPENGEGEEGWDDFEQYKVGDNTYDLTGENDYDSVVKVYRLLNDDDQVVVKKDGNMLQLQDNEAGTEYVIDLGGEDDEASGESIDGEEEMPNEMNESYFNESDDDYDFAGIQDDDFDDEGDEFDDGLYDDFDDDSYGEEAYDDLDDTYDDFDDESHDDFDDEDNFDGIYENKRNKKNRKPMREGKEVLFEVDLGYTDNYQDKDPIAGLSNNEPSKSGKSWHKGVPTGTQKPWAGDSKSKGDPFKKTQKVKDSVNEEDWSNPEMAGKAAESTMDNGEIEEAAMSTSSQSVAKKTNTRTSEPRKNNARQVAKNMHTAQGAVTTNESKELKTIKKENKELKKAIVELRKNLNEAYITNVNLGKIAKLFLENTTSQKEKIEIVNRFSNEAKTVEQSKALYESINKQLKKSNKSLNINESSKTANGTKTLNENSVYKSADLLKTIDFMNRVLDC